MSSSLLVLLLCFCVSSLQVQAEVTCRSRGVCSPSEERCKADSLSSCFQRDIPGSYRDNIDGVTVRQCPSGRGGFVRPCAASSSVSDTPPAVLTGVDAKVVSFDPDYFSVNVSWTANNVSDHFAGYQVTLFERKTQPFRSPRVKRCVCIENTNMLNFDFLYMNYERKHFSKNLSVEILPYPLPASADKSSYFERSEEVVKPKGCADAHLGHDSVCDVKRYGSATNLNIQSNVTCSDAYSKELNISWEHPSVLAGNPHPPSYYLYVYSERSLKHLFKVDNATSVVLKNLNASLDYEAQLQAYGKCSGLGDLHVSLERFLGCGRKSLIGREDLSLEKCDAVTPLPDVVTTDGLPSTPVDNNTKKEAGSEDPPVDVLFN